MIDRRGDRAALVAAAEASIAAGSKSFAQASRLFHRTTRERVWLLYAWCRACDDIADGQDHGGTMHAVSDPAARLARIVAATDAAYAGQRTGLSAFDGLAQLLTETPIERPLADDLVEGFRLDLTDWRPQGEADLLRYAYHVAGVVGLMMRRVMTPDAAPDAGVDRAAIDLGLAFQLANISRDVAEDAAGGRTYLPADWLADAGIAPAAIMEPRHRAALVSMIRRVDAMALECEASARRGARALPWRSRWAVLSAANIYGAIMRTVVARGAAAWDRRVVVPRRAKAMHVARALFQSAAAA